MGLLLNLSVPGHDSPLMVWWQSEQNRWEQWADWKTVVVDSLEPQREQESREVKVSLITEREFVKSYWSRLDMFSLVSGTVVIPSVEFTMENIVNTLIFFFINK